MTEDQDLAEAAGAILGSRSEAERADLARSRGLDPESVEAWRAEALDALAQRANPGDSAPPPGLDHEPPLRLHHVGIVVREEERMERFAASLGLRETRRDHLEKYRVTNVFFQGDGGGEVQFMLPSAGMLANFNRGRGGLHHIAFCTPDLARTQASFKARGFSFIDPEPQVGIDRFRFNFIHPHLEGINVELIEDPEVSWP